MSVLPRGVSADLVDGSALVDRAVAVDDDVITYVGEAAGKMPLADLLDSKILPLRRRRAMEDYLVDAASVR